MESSIWDGIESAEIYERGNYVKPGFVGIVEVVRTIAKDTLKSGKAFIVEMRVLETNLPEHPVGSKVTWYQGMNNKLTAFPAIKIWAAACVGYEAYQKADIEREVSPVIRELMKISTDNPDKNDFVGTKLILRTTQTKTKEKGLDFTVYDFHPCAQ